MGEPDEEALRRLIAYDEVAHSDVEALARAIQRLAGRKT